ncbi:uncharacterized protein IL334_005539 [Kwoniella shivajii]|uniref:Mitochondrial inner membrane protein 1 n=1 Tax=Kwoniella shivajii TaxID=564305 RepID=A0ABZ1D7E6_9TREE|nr:hypothetical protein IL334_005539 [Kwoniella shivajii]
MNRTILTRKSAFLLPIRPRPSPLPTNLSRPNIALTASGSGSGSNPGLTVGQALFPHLKGVRFYATDKNGGKEKKQGEVKHHNREDQNTTSGAAEELKGMTRDFAKIISGSTPEAAAAGAREVSAAGAHVGGITEDFMSVTKGMFTSVPKPVLYTGLAGTIPYLGTSLSIVALAREASLAVESGGESPAGLDLATALSYLHTMEHIQITYGAIILSFLGALHWGMEFAKLGGEQGYSRLILGIVPVLAAWPTLLATHGVALAVQWFGFTGMWLLDQRATIAGWTTSWYSTYRFYLSLIVGFSIIGTLVGTSMYGAGAGAITDIHSPHLQHTTERTSALKRLDRVKERNYPKSSDAKVNKVQGKVAGPIQVEEESSGEGFLKLRNIQREQEEKEEEEQKQKEEEEAKKQKQKEQDEKESKQKNDSPDGMKEGQKNRAAGESEKDQGKKKAKEQGADKQQSGEKEQDKEGDDDKNDEGEGEDKVDKKDEGKENKKDEGKEKKKDEGKEKKKDEGKDKDQGKEQKDKGKEDDAEKKDNGNDKKDNQGGDNKDGKQQKAAEEKGAAGDKNTGMK